MKRIKKIKKHPTPPRQAIVPDTREDALERMYRRYADGLYAYGLTLHPDISIIEDAIHDVFIDIYTNEQRLAGIANMRLYLRAAFRHRLLFLLQGNRRYVEMLDETPDSLTVKNIQELWIENEEENDKINLVNNLLSGLNRNQREALHLRFIEGFSYDEIAEILQINYQSAKTLVYRSLLKIRDKNIPSFFKTD